MITGAAVAKITHGFVGARSAGRLGACRLCISSTEEQPHDLEADNPYARVTIPDHKQVRVGTLRRIVADAGLSLEEFLSSCLPSS